MPLIPDANPLLTLAVVLATGIAFGSAARRFGLPAITGQVVAGILIGPWLGLFDTRSVDTLRPVTHFALALMAVTTGGHLHLKRMRNAGKRLLILVLFEATLTPVLVTYSLVFFLDMSWGLALLLGTLAISTAPATVVALVKEARARGVLAKTLVAAVALNNVTCILLFELVRADVSVQQSTAINLLLAPARQILFSALIGGGAAAGMHFLSRFITRPEVLSSGGFLAILLVSGMAEYLRVSSLLSCLFLGMVQVNLTVSREKQVDAVFANFEPAILAVFFTLAGMNLHFDHAETAGLAGAVFFLARASGKILSVRAAMWLAGATDNVKRWLGPALLPQAGLAIGLVLVIQNDPAFASRQDFLHLLLAIVLTVVTVNEIVGPILTRLALKRSGEVGMDRQRLLDFIQEENILTDLHARTKEEAIGKLVDHMIRSHHLSVERSAILASVLEREAQASTCMGSGLSIPHAVLPDGHSTVGVMGLSREGIMVPTPDGRPVHCMVLFGTSPSERDRHLQILATLARCIGMDPSFQERLFASTSPGHASEILHGEASESFNYFLDD